MEKESTRKPKLRFSGFSESWKKTTLGELLTFKNGLNAGKEDYGDGEKFINVLDIIQNNFITHDKIIGSVKASEKNKELYKVEYGDVLFQRSSETREEVGQANVYLDREKPALFGGFVIRGKKKSDYDPIFINHLLKTPLSRQEITSKSGGSTRYNVGQETLSSVEITIATLPEQQKIASFLSAVDERIELLERKKEKLEAYKKGVMQQIFPSTGSGQAPQIRFKQDDGSDFPDWEEKRLGEVLKIGSGKDYKHLGNGDIPVFGTGGLMTYVDDFIYEGESVGIGRKGTIDKPMFLTGKFWTVDTLFYTHSFKQIVPRFVYLVFQTINWKAHNEASGVPSLSKTTIEKLKIMLPSTNEQLKIVAFTEEIQNSISNLDSQIQGLRNWKKGLLQQMFV